MNCEPKPDLSQCSMTGSLAGVQAGDYANGLIQVGLRPSNIWMFPAVELLRQPASRDMDLG